MWLSSAHLPQDLFLQDCNRLKTLQVSQRRCLKSIYEAFSVFKVAEPRNHQQHNMKQT